jgi:hypothetical protein
MKAKLMTLSLGVTLAVATGCSSNSEHGGAAGHTSGSTNAPNAPSELKVAEASGGAHLTWKDNSDNEDQFMIERKQGNGSFTTLDTVGANKPEYHDGKVTAGTTYSYRVMAMGKDGSHSASSNEVVFKAPGPAAPAADAGGAADTGSSSTDTASTADAGNVSDGATASDTGSVTTMDAKDAAGAESGGHSGGHK